MSFFERLTRFGMTKKDWDESMFIAAAEMYTEMAEQQYGFDLSNDISLKTSDDLDRKLEEAEGLGLDRGRVYGNYFHCYVLKRFGRTHLDCHPWYTQPYKAA